MVYALVAANLTVFLATRYLLPWDAVLAGYGFVPSAPGWQALFAAMFLHAGWLHILGNLFFLWMFADNVEDVVGPVAFLGLYLACGLAATSLYYLSDPGSSTPCVGASGAISGVLGLYMAFFRYAHVDIALYVRHTKLAVFHTSALGAALAWLSEQTLLGLLTRLTESGQHVGVAFWAHVGGLLGGLTLGMLLKFAGIRAPLPTRTLRFERDKAAEVWCPHCGEREVGISFGEFRCALCGTRYVVAQAKGEVS